MDGPGKSDRSILPAKRPNKAGRSVAEAVEGRGLAKGNTGQQNAPRTQRRVDGAHSALDRVREAAKKDRKARFTALLHHVNIDRLREAFLGLRREAAPGVDGMTWEQYAGNQEENLQGLHARLQRGAYRAKPSRRVRIPRADGQHRLLGIASLEDKIVQRAVMGVLNAIYETDSSASRTGSGPGVARMMRWMRWWSGSVARR